MRRIDADALDIGGYREDFPVCECDVGWNAAVRAVEGYVDAAPTIDAVPVVHGVWERSIDNDCPMHKCSVCGARVVKGLYEYENPNLYCYHCGAKMDGERRSDD